MPEFLKFIPPIWDKIKHSCLDESKGWRRGQTFIEVSHLEGDVNQVVQRMMSLRLDIGVMRFVDNELDRDKIIVAFKTG